MTTITIANTKINKYYSNLCNDPIIIGFSDNVHFILNKDAVQFLIPFFNETKDFQWNVSNFYQLLG